jgi:hypothetical protein
VTVFCRRACLLQGTYWSTILGASTSTGTAMAVADTMQGHLRALVEVLQQGDPQRWQQQGHPAALRWRAQLLDECLHARGSEAFCDRLAAALSAEVVTARAALPPSDGNHETILRAILAAVLPYASAEDLEAQVAAVLVDPTAHPQAAATQRPVRPLQALAPAAHQLDERYAYPPDEKLLDPVPLHALLFPRLLEAAKERLASSRHCSLRFLSGLEAMAPAPPGSSGGGEGGAVLEVRPPPLLPLLQPACCEGCLGVLQRLVRLPCPAAGCGGGGHRQRRVLLTRRSQPLMWGSVDAACVWGRGSAAVQQRCACAGAGTARAHAACPSSDVQPSAVAGVAGTGVGDGWTAGGGRRAGGAGGALPEGGAAAGGGELCQRRLPALAEAGGGAGRSAAAQDASHHPRHARCCKARPGSLPCVADSLCTAASRCAASQSRFAAS